MATLLTSSSTIRTLGDLLDRLGGVPADRVRYFPLPGTATEQDVIDIETRENIHCELIDGVLLEKTVGYEESFLAMFIVTALNNFVLPSDLGVVTGPDGMIRLFPGLVRIPDVAFASNARLPGGKVPREPVPSLVPDLAVEVLSDSNTIAEMDRKREEYFLAGVRLVWIVDPKTRTVEVYTAGAEPVTLHEGQTLDGGEVLPEFALDLTAMFAKLSR